MAYLKKIKNPSWVKSTSKHEGRTSKTDFYQKGAWRRIRNLYIKNNPLCVECVENGIIEKADVVDHIKQISKGGQAYSFDNLQSLCSTCHNQKSGRERHGKPQGGVSSFRE